MAILINQILAKNSPKAFSVEPLTPINLAGSHSRLVRQNRGVLYGSIFSGLEGLFRKDVEASRLYGRQRCGQVQAQFACGGFFTTDELPRYGITRRETQLIYQQMGTHPGSGDLIVLCAYNKTLSQQIVAFLAQEFIDEMNGSAPSASRR